MKLGTGWKGFPWREGLTVGASAAARS